jgi:gamma-glutamyltranspeptidase/glutathione hydrolase
MTERGTSANWSTQFAYGTSAEGDGGALTAGHPMSVAAGLKMLDQGGNAIDAAVAAALVAGVVEPQETTLAGSGFLLVQKPGEEPISVEFGPRAPMAAETGMYRIDRDRREDRGLGVSTVVGDEHVIGPRASGVPGNIVGLLTAHELLGLLDRRTVMQPAIEAAANGFEASASFVLGLVAYRESLLADPVSSEVFFPQGRIPAIPHMGRTFGAPATVVINAALARTLEVIAEQGAESMQTGEVARDVVATMDEIGGLISAEDLARPRVDIVPPRILDYRGWQISATRAPSGGLTELEMLAGWQELHRNGEDISDAERVTDLARLSLHVFADRYHWLGDPLVVPVPEDALLSRGYARALAEWAKDGASTPRPSEEGAFPWEIFACRAIHDPWPHDPQSRPSPRWRPDGGTEASTGTTHVSVLDGRGMAVSITHTAANLFGAHRMCPRTGLMFDSAMNWFNAEANAANSVRGGARPLANMGPLIISADGHPRIALGAPGGRRIASALVQVTINLLDRGMSAGEALAEPRIDASGGRVLIQERLRHVIPQLPDDLEAVVIEESGEYLIAEMARPGVVVRTGRKLEAAVHTPSPGAAAAF